MLKRCRQNGTQCNDQTAPSQFSRSSTLLRIITACHNFDSKRNSSNSWPILFNKLPFKASKSLYLYQLWYYKLSKSYLRNKFHFSEVHGSMNATGHMQSKWRPKGVMLTLHGTRYVHTSMNVRKMKFISYIYTLFLHRFCSLFVEFYSKSCK